MKNKLFKLIKDFFITPYYTSEQKSVLNEFNDNLHKWFDIHYINDKLEITDFKYEFGAFNLVNTLLVTITLEHPELLIGKDKKQLKSFQKYLGNNIIVKINSLN